MCCNLKVASLTLACLFLVSACGSRDHSNVATSGDTKVSVDAVRAALDQKNFGLAASLAEKLATQDPANVDTWLVAADAKAASGSRLGALAALESALKHGMRDTIRVDEDHYLDGIRSSGEYRALLARFGLVQPAAQAGDTSIAETATGTVVRAGDVSVTIPNTK